MPDTGATVDSIGYVYFVMVRRGRKWGIKIGSTGACPYRRLAGIRAEMPKWSSYELLGSIQTTQYRAGERALQRRFRHLWHHGDWFLPGPDLWKVIEDTAKPHRCTERCFARTRSQRERLIERAHFEAEVLRATTFIEKLGIDFLNGRRLTPSKVRAHIRAITPAKEEK